MPIRDALEKEGETPRPRKKGEVRILHCCSMKAFAVGELKKYDPAFKKSFSFVIIKTMHIHCRTILECRKI